MTLQTSALLLTCITALAQTSSTTLRDTMQSLDTQLFDAANRCDYARLTELVDENLEFYHDNFEGKDLSPMLYDYFLRNYDQNGDGDITQAEFMVMRAADRALSGADFNRDGKISGREMNEWAKSDRWRDRNGDGTMTAAEFLQASMGWNVLADLRRDMEAQRKKREEEDAKKQAGKPA